MQLTVDTELLDALPQRLAEPRLWRRPPARRPRPAPPASSRRFLAATPTSAPPDHLQAIANTAGFHFAWIEQGGTSLYAELAQRVTHSEVLRILLSIGGYRDHALPDLARQSRQRASAHRPDEWSGLPRPERRR